MPVFHNRKQVLEGQFCQTYQAVCLVGVVTIYFFLVGQTCIAAVSAFSISSWVYIYMIAQM